VEGAGEVLLEWSGGAKGGFGESSEHILNLKAGLLILPPSKENVSPESPHAVGKPAPAKASFPKPAEGWARAAEREGEVDALMRWCIRLTGWLASWSRRAGGQCHRPSDSHGEYTERVSTRASASTARSSLLVAVGKAAQDGSMDATHVFW
jgi:hypothetical protein